MKTVLMADPVRYPRMNTDELRDTFLLGALCEPGQLHLNYVDLDRAVVGFAAPLELPSPCPPIPNSAPTYFTERRELGALNIGGAGVITVEGKSYELNNLDVLYIGRGNKQVTFASKDKSAPAIYYLLSYPAHAVYPVALVRKADASPTELGSARNLQQAHHLQIHSSPGRAQLPARHGRHASRARQQLEHHASAHPHAPLRNLYVLQPRRAMRASCTSWGRPPKPATSSWPTRASSSRPAGRFTAGVGTRAYSFCWGMGGENQDYADMDPAPVESLR